MPPVPGYDRVVSDTPRSTHEERIERTKSQYVLLGDYCGRVDQVDGGTLVTRFDDHSLSGRVRETHEYFQTLYEQQAKVPTERIWADGANVPIAAYRYDPERHLVRMKTERTTRPAGD